VPPLTRGLTILIVALLALAPAAAYAHILDPTWRGGFWDDNDVDDLVLLVIDGTASLPAVAPRLQPTTHVGGVVSVHVADAPFLERRLPFHRRGPPLV
jgi:hypothetical protein